MKSRRELRVALYAALLSTLAATQSSAQSNPTDGNASVPVVNYQSVFSDYRPFREHKGNSWLQVNKEVAENPGMGSMGMKDSVGPGMADMSHGKGAKQTDHGPGKGEKK